MIQNERTDVWSKKSWLDEFVSSPRLAKDLTSIYAEDVLQGIEDKSFNSLDEALAALKTQSGLTTAEVKNVQRLVIAATEPESFVAEENILKANKKDLSALLVLATTVCEECKEAPCTCSKTLASPIAKAINRIGLETLAEMCDKSTVDTQPADIAAEEEETAKRLKEAEASRAVPLTAEADRVKALLANGSTVAEAMEKAAGGMNPGFQAYLDNKKKEGEGGKPSDEEPKKDEEKKGEAKASVKKADRAEDKAEHEKVEGELKKVEKEVEKHESREAKEAEASLRAKAERWADFLSTKGYFQGANEPVNTSDGVSNDKCNSNDPTKLGLGSKDGVQYDRGDMAVPVGGDSRQWEQGWFEETAKDTKKVMGPSGEELKLKKDLLRARYLFQVRKLADKKKAALNKSAKTPPDISEGTAHKIKDEYPGEPEKAYATMWKIENEKNKKK